MGVKELWTILTPHAERKPISELRGKTVAIDLAGWVCESLNVVDYFVHPRHHLKNLFFRTCYLIWEEVTPVFVLEGAAPKLKSQTIAKRNELQFRGVRPKEQQPVLASQQTTAAKANTKNDEKGRTRFNHVLKQCEKLLNAMGIQCVQGPGEAEAYCAYLNKKGLVDGVISQDSDCFAYGAVRVYRNFSVSTQGAQAAQGGAIDIYDMSEIARKIDFGQNKVIVLALLCGCDYCPDGIGGIGRDSVLKLFQKYTNDNVLERLRNWRNEDAKYTALEMRVDDKTICSNCGHLGRTQQHTKSGCGVCRTHRGCDESLWKEQRLAIKAELNLRKKALADANFPSEEIIEEFLKEPLGALRHMDLNWRQPNIVKFIKQIGHLLQWTELYCFQKFFPILTRWQVRHPANAHAYVSPKELIKKRTVKGVASLELVWQDEHGFFAGLIPDEQLENYKNDNPKGLQELWTTIEPLHMCEVAYHDMVTDFLNAKNCKKPNKTKANAKKAKAKPLGSLDNLNELMQATAEIGKTLKPKRNKSQATQATTQKRAGLQLIDKFFKQNVQKALSGHSAQQCSTPITKAIPSDLESDCDENVDNLSAIVDDIVKKPNLNLELKMHVGRTLFYEPITHDLSMRLAKQSLDDHDILAEKRKYNRILEDEAHGQQSRYSLDDSFDVLVKKENHRLQQLSKQLKKSYTPSPLALLTFDADHVPVWNKSMETVPDKENNVSFFYGTHSAPTDDVFEHVMELNFSRKLCSSNDYLVLSDDDE